MNPNFEIRPATVEDVPLILDFIKKLAVYEKLAHKAVATEEILCETLFGVRQYGEVVIGFCLNRPVCFALFFHTFSTFLGRPGIYLEDLFVDEEYRGKGFGKALLVYLAQLAAARNCGRLEWAVLNWNEPAIKFFESLGARPMDEWTFYRLAGEALKALANSPDENIDSQS
jgi:GNAT superfamily N-acetyltransferase